MEDFNKIVICPKCHNKETYGNMHWRNGETMCRKCIEHIWLQDRIDRENKKQMIKEAQQEILDKYE